MRNERSPSVEEPVRAHLLVDDGPARLQHLPRGRDDLRRDLGQDLGDRLAEDRRRVLVAERPEDVVDPNEAEVAVDDRDPHL